MFAAANKHGAKQLLTALFPAAVFVLENTIPYVGTTLHYTEAKPGP
jgi:hypothetical protein